MAGNAAYTQKWIDEQMARWGKVVRDNHIVNQ